MKSQYYKQIDGLRFVAIFLVLIEHFAHSIGQKISAGYYGVDLFFVISGFLITKILLKQEGNFFINYKNFLGRRILRIFPIYYLTILILFLSNYPPVHDYLIYFVTYTYNYAWVAFDIPLNSLSHFWSLAVEEQFYLFWPILILSLKSKPKLLLTIIATIAIICSIQLLFSAFPSIANYNGVGLFPQANSLSIGAIGAFLLNSNLLPYSILKSKYFEYFTIIALGYLLIFGGIYKLVVCPIISLYFILKCCTRDYKSKFIDKFLSHKTITYIGSISYGIYVFHLPLDYYFTKYIFDPFFWNQINFEDFGQFRILRWNSWLIKFPLYSILSIFVAHISYKFIEKPILALKDKYFKY
jgi:peptidoglycan/LPS O-acetylase OafA/YrhL